MTEAGNFKFPGIPRITRGQDFERVYKKGRRARGRYFTVFFDKNQLPFSRFGFTVSRKLGNAVQRNRIKRIFREAVRTQRFHAMLGFDFVFNPHPSALKLKSTKLGEDLTAVFRELNERYGPSVHISRDSSVS